MDVHNIQNVPTIYQRIIKTERNIKNRQKEVPSEPSYYHKMITKISIKVTVYLIKIAFITAI